MVLFYSEVYIHYVQFLLQHASLWMAVSLLT